MYGLHVHLLGSIRVLAGKPSSDIKISGIPRTLLTYLLIRRSQVHTRDSLAALFWGEQGGNSARNCLNTVLWRLRKALEPTGTPRGTYVLTTEAGEVGFNSNSDYWLDVAVFEERAMQVIQRSVDEASQEEARGLEEVLSLFHGDPLEGCYEDWALRERERLRSLRFRALAWLMRYFEYRQDFDRALACGNRVLAVDPLREDIVRAVMQLYQCKGQRTEGLRLFRKYTQMLRSELGVAPMIETQAVYAGILTEPNAGAVAAQNAPDHTVITQLRMRIQVAMDRLDRMREDLEQILQSVKSIDRSMHVS